MAPGPRCSRWRVDKSSGPRACEARDFLIALAVCAIMNCTGLSSLCFLLAFVVVLFVLELTCGFTEANCLLNLLAESLGLVLYLPLNLIAWLQFAFTSPFRFLISLKSLEESVLRSSFSTVSLHLLRLWLLISVFMSLFS